MLSIFPIIIKGAKGPKRPKGLKKNLGLFLKIFLAYRFLQQYTWLEKLKVTKEDL